MCALFSRVTTVLKTKIPEVCDTLTYQSDINNHIQLRATFNATIKYKINVSAIQ